MSDARSLVVTDVSKHFGGVAALTGVSIEARPGDITGLIGPNGAGKTTLFNVVTGFYGPDEGSVGYGALELTGLSPNAIARAGVVRTFQDVHIFRGMTALENLEVGVTRGTSLDEPLDLLRLTAQTRGWGIPLDVPVGSLSFGDQKVVAMARALALGASALLLDEPASGLDEGSIDVLLVLLRSLREQGKLVLLVEHNMGLVMSICDRLFVLANGSVLADGTPAEIQRNRAVIDAYLGGGGTPVPESEEVAS